MSCPRIDAYLDGTLTPASHREVEVHLDNCTRCRCYVADWRAFVRALQKDMRCNRVVSARSGRLLLSRAKSRSIG